MSLNNYFIKHKIKFIFFFACLFVCPEVFAALFDVVPTDRSKQYLGTIFGGNVGLVYLGGESNPLLSKMVEKFNFIIVSVASVVLSYIGVLSVINTAREGEALGKKFSAWIILKAFLGMLLMVPTPATGYSIIQVTVMWLVLNGIGAANLVWGVVLNQLSAGIQAVGTSESLSGANEPALANKALKTNLGHKVFNSIVCMKTLNKLNIPAVRSGGPVKIIRKDESVTNTSGKSEISVGVDSPGFTKLCGSYVIGMTTDSSNSNWSMTVIDTQTRLNIKVNALLAMFDTLTPAANLIIENTTPETGYVAAAGGAYRTQIMQLSTQGTSSNTPSPAEGINELRQIGWIHAGNYYFSLAKSSREAVDSNALTMPGGIAPYGEPWVKVPNDPTSAPSNWQQTSHNLKNQLSLDQREILNRSLQDGSAFLTRDADTQAITSIPNLISSSPGTGSEIMDKLIETIADPLTSKFIEFLQDQMNSLSDPIAGLARFGWGLMTTAEISGLTMMMVAFGLALAASPMMCVSPTAPPVVGLLMQTWLMVTGLCLMIWTAGATLNIYLPMIPYLVFTATAFGWFLSVTEAMLGAPVIALSLVQPTGEELGRVTQGLGILANVFLKPTLMIFGFILAASLVRAGVNMVNFGFIAAVTNKPPMSTMFSFIAVLMMYMLFMIAIVNKAFSLIYELPNQILRYMGGPIERHDPGELVKEAKGGFESGARAASQGLGKGLESVSKKLEKDREKLAKNAGSAGIATGDENDAAFQDNDDAIMTKNPLFEAEEITGEEMTQNPLYAHRPGTTSSRESDTPPPSSATPAARSQPPSSERDDQSPPPPPSNGSDVAQPRTPPADNSDGSSPPPPPEEE